MKYFVTNNVNGYITEINNIDTIAEKINLLWKNKDLRKEMSRNSIEKAKSLPT
jgi:hypothetical protein